MKFGSKYTSPFLGGWEGRNDNREITKERRLVCRGSLKFSCGNCKKRWRLHCMVVFHQIGFSDASLFYQTNMDWVIVFHENGCFDTKWLTGCSCHARGLTKKM